MLDVYGSLLYAGVRTLQVRLPDPTGCRRAVVVLRLRGRSTLGSTFFAVVSDHASRLAEGGGRLYLSGVSPSLLDQMQAAKVLRDTAGLVVVPETEIIGHSTRDAYDRARAWLDQGGESLR